MLVGKFRLRHRTQRILFKMEELDLWLYLLYEFQSLSMVPIYFLLLRKAPGAGGPRGSVFLFNIVEDVFSLLICRGIRKNNFRGFSLGSEAFVVCHLQYVDDTILFLGMAQASVNNVSIRARDSGIGISEEQGMLLLRFLAANGRTAHLLFGP